MRIDKTKHFDTILFLVLFVIILFLSWKLAEFRGDRLGDSNAVNPGSELTDMFFAKVIPEFSLRSLEGGYYNYFHRSNDKYAVVIFFTPWDCQSCFDEVPLWNHLSLAFRDRLEILAIGTAKTFDILRRFVEKNDIKVKALYDENELLFRILGIKDLGITPIKFIVDSRGIIIHVSTKTPKDAPSQQQYIGLIDTLTQK